VPGPVDTSTWDVPAPTALSGPAVRPAAPATVDTAGVPAPSPRPPAVVRAISAPPVRRPRGAGPPQPVLPGGVAVIQLWVRR
jgi:hypothetical protein